MHYRSELLGVANHIHRTRRVRAAVVRAAALALVAALALFIDRANAQNALPPAMESASPDAGAPPMSQSGGGDLSYFSQNLGTILRLRYNTNSYGQDGTGNFDIGTMQIATMGDTAAFFDGQVTMNESDGVGFNVGLGYRWMSFPELSGGSGRMDGISLWADGTHTDAGNFFPQVGVSYESLGEVWDLRANSYIPVGNDEQVGAFSATNQIGFDGNSISEITRATVDKSFFAADIEVARRLGAQRDAWGFAGPYFVANDDEDSAGFRTGVRGYAYPDLLLQFAVSHDDVFETNATFSIVWFVGRTRTDFQPACGTPDRFREPVMRNDYVVLSHKNRFGGNPLTNPDGSALRIVHIDSNAAAGGDGTAERPFDLLTDVNGAGSQTGDILFAHSTSVFTGESSVILKDNQRLLGEGNNFVHTIATLQEGTIDIPESSPGARALARPQINGFTGDAVTLAVGNEVSNFDIDGQGTTARAIAAPAGGAGNPNLNHLSIKNTTGDGIAFTPATVTDPNDATKSIVRGNVAIDTVTFDNVGGDDIDINSATASDLTDPNVTLQEAIAISNVTSTNGNGAGVRLADTHSAGSALITNYTNGNAAAGSGGGLAGEGVLRFEGSAADKFAGDVTLNNADIKNNLGFAFDFKNVASTSIVNLGTGSSWDGGAGVAGGLRADAFNGDLTASNTALTGGTLGGIKLLNASAGSFDIQDTVTLTNIGGTDVDVDGGAGDLFTGQALIASAINNTDGRSVSVQGISTATALVSLDGDIKDTALGVLVNSNAGGLIQFTEDLDMDTTTNTAVAVTDNTGAEIDFQGKVDINTTTGAGFIATGGGTLTASAANNTITTTSGQVLRIGGPLVTDGMTISADNVKFADVNNTSAGAVNAIQIENNKGTGSIDIGTVTDTAGDAGTINGGTNDAIFIHNSPNVSVNGVRVNNTAAFAGVRVNKSNTTPMSVTLGNLEVNDGSDGVKVTGGGLAGNLNMTISQTAINGSTVAGMSFDNVDFGTITVNGANIDGNNANATAKGVSITNSNATFNFDTATQIHEWSGDDFSVSGGTGLITFAGDIVNTDADGRSIRIQNVSGGTITFTADNTVDDTNDGILITNNTGGTYNFNGTYNLNTGANDAVTVTNNGGPPGATINLGGLNIDTTSGQGLVATGGGTLSVIGLSNTIDRTAGGIAGFALDIEGMTIGSVDFEHVNATGGQNGVRLVDNTGGTVTIGDTGNAVGQGGTITGTADAGVRAQNTNVTLNGVTVTNAGDAGTDNGVEILHTNATAMNANLNRVTVTNPTAARNGVLVDGTGGSGTFNANVQNLNVNVTGNGFDANDGVTLTAGGTNTITSATGVGLRLADVTIAGAGANFQSVTVTNGTTNGIVMQNVTGGQVAVTGTGSTNNSGGQLTTTGDAIVLSDVTNVDLSNVRVVNASGAGSQGLNIDHTAGATTAMDVTITNFDMNASTGAGIDVASVNNANNFNLRLLNSDIDRRVVMSHSSAGDFGLLLDNNTFDTTGTDVAFTLGFSGAAVDGDVTIRNNNRFTAADATAFAFTAGGANTDIEFSATDNIFANASGTAVTATFLANTSSTLNANVVNNTFTNSLAADRFAMTSDGPNTRINLNLDNNTANGDYELTTANNGGGFNFGVVDRDNADANNVGTVNFNPLITDFEDIAGPVESPDFP